MNKKRSRDHKSTGRPFLIEGSVNQSSRDPYVVGVLEGEGVGPVVVGIAIKVLESLQSVTGYRFDIRCDSALSIEPAVHYSKGPSHNVLQLCEEVFNANGAVIAGAGGGRFVYGLRKHFDLFCKLVPITPWAELFQAGHMKRQYVEGVDIMLVRENVSGAYFGRFTESTSASNGRVVEYSFSYSEQQVRRILKVAADMAVHRRGKLTVSIKDGGLPGISDLFRDCAGEIALKVGVSLEVLNIDYVAYLLLQHAHDLDVLVAPNLFGDILADVSAVLLGSRGLAYSGNFSSTSAAVYQTNHGGALDLVGRNSANPIGQILSTAMMLRHSFGLDDAATLVEDAVAQVLRKGFRTVDIMEPQGRLVGTIEMGDLVCRAVVDVLSEG